MTDRDEILIKDSIALVADAIVDEIAKVFPGMGLVWNLTKALKGAGMKLRQERVVEWVEMVRDNPGFFTNEILSDEKFQDGFVLALEKYLTERSLEKRKYFRNIFLGFAQAEDKNNFPLEKFTHTLSQLNETDVIVLKDVKPEEEGRNYQIYPANSDKIENIFNLIREGILLDTTGNRLGYPQDSPSVKTSIFGREFIKYITG